MGGIMSDNIHINKNINIDKKEEKKPELLDDNRVAIIDMQHESEDEKAVRIQTLFDNAKKTAKDNLRTKDQRNELERKITNHRKLIANDEFWGEMRRDFRGQEEFVDRKLISEESMFREELLMSIMGNDTFMKEPGIAEIMKKVTALNDALSNPLVELSETEFITASYKSLLISLKDYNKSASAKNSKLPAKDQMKELLGLFAGEAKRFDRDVTSWKTTGVIPRQISKGLDIVNRKHVCHELDNTGKSDLLNLEVKILALQRDKGKGDSPQMKDVKTALTLLAKALNTKIEPDDADFLEQKNIISAIFEDVIAKCTTYIKGHKNPYTTEGKERKAAVLQLLDFASAGKVSVPVAAKSFVKWGVENATWADAYGITDKDQIVSSNTKAAKSAALNEAEKEEQLEKQFEKKRAKKIAEEEETKKNENILFRKRYKPNEAAREYFIKTGTWKADLKKDEEILEGDKQKNWYLHGHRAALIKRLAELDVVTDEEFVEEAKKINENIRINYAWLEDPENLGEMKKKFLERTREMLGAHKNKDKKSVVTDHSGQDFDELLHLDYREIDDLIMDFYKTNINPDLLIRESGARMQLDEKFDPDNMHFKVSFFPIQKMAEQKKKLDKSLGLSTRGADIYKSDAIRYLIVKMDELDPEYKNNMEALKSQAEGNDAMISLIIESKFSPLTKKLVYKNLREYLGDKALFWNYRKLRDLTESYLRTMSVTDRTTMRIERDFDVAYTGTVKSPFSLRFKDAAAKYLFNLNHGNSEYSYVEKAKRTEEMEKNLSNVNLVLKSLEKEVKGKKLSAAAWDKLLSNYEKFIGEDLHRFGDLSIKDEAKRKEQDKKLYINSLENNFKKYKGSDDDIIDFSRADFEPLIKDKLENATVQARNKKYNAVFDKKLKELDASIQLYNITDQRKISELRMKIVEELENDLNTRFLPEIEKEAYRMAVMELPEETRKEILDKTKEQAMNSYVANVTGEAYNEYKPLNAITKEQLFEDMKKLAEDSVKEYEEKDGISFDEYITGEKEAKKTKILPDDFSYASIFTKQGILENEDVKKVIPDDKLREFLAKNIGTILIGNPVLMEKFSFMRSIKGLGQLDGSLTFGQFQMVMQDVIENLTGEKQQEALKKALSEDHDEETKKYLLLSMAKSRTDVAGVDSLLAELKERDDKAEFLKKQRLHLDLGKKYVPRDGKIRFRFDDMMDREKSWKSIFGIGSGWLKGRIERFDRANETWKNLEETSPEAVEQVKKWMRYVLEASDGNYKDAMTLLDTLAETLKEGSSITDKKSKKSKGLIRSKGDKFKGNVFLIDEEIEKKYIKRTSQMGANMGAVKGDLMESIKKAFGTLLKSADEEKLLKDIRNLDSKVRMKDMDAKKSASPGSYLLEMLMFNNQDVIFGHRGKGQQDFFIYNGYEQSDEYNKAILKWAKESQLRDDLLEKQLSAYEGNKSLKKELKDKLFVHYMNMDLEKNKKMADEISGLEEEIKKLDEEEKELNRAVDGLKKAFQDYMQANLEEVKKGKSVDETLMKGMQDSIVEYDEKAVKATTDKKKKQKELDKLKESYSKLETTEKFEEILKNEIHADGSFSDEICDDVVLYETRRSLFCDYKDGKLAPLWNAIEKNDALFTKLMDPAGSVALEEIEKLYERLAPLGTAITEVYEYVGSYYLEDHIDKLLNTDSKEWESHAKALLNLDEKGQTQYWHDVLKRFQDDYLSNRKKGTKSINDVFKDTREYMDDELGKQLYYNSFSVEFDLENQNAMFTKWLFFDSDNYGLEKTAEGFFKSQSRIAIHHAEAINSMVELYIHDNTDLMQYAASRDALKAFYDNEMIPRILKNIDVAGKAFLNYVLQNEYNIKPKERGEFLGDVNELVGTEITDGLSQLLEEERLSVIKRLVEFREQIMPQMIGTDSKTFYANANEIAKDYITRQKKAIEEDESFSEEHRASYIRRQKEMDGDRLAVQIEKSKGRDAYNNKLFGGYLDRLKEFGEKKQSLVYVAKRGALNAELNSKTEKKDDKLYEAALERFITDQGEAPYPPILAELFDEFCRLSSGYKEQGERFISWMAGNSLYDNEVNRLKRIADCVKKTNVDPEWQDFLITYTARFSESSEKGVMDGMFYEKVIETALHGIERITELESIPVKNPALVLAHRDACQKMRAWMFVESDKDERTYRKFDEMVDAQKNYFSYAEMVYGVIDETLSEDEYVGGLDSVYRAHIENAMHDYFTARIIADSGAFVSGKKELDSEGIKKTVRGRIRDTYRRDALVYTKDSVSNEDFESQNVYNGQMTRRDFEKALVLAQDEGMLEEYNNLKDDEKQIFVMSLYASQHIERGSSRVVYGQKDEERDDARDQIISFISGEKISFQVDYGRAIRALQTKGDRLKISTDKEAFNQALEYTKMLMKKKAQLRPRDWDRISGDSLTAMIAGDVFRNDLKQSFSDVKDNCELARELSLTERRGFVEMLKNLQVSDRKREKEQGKFASLGRYYNQLKEGSRGNTVMERLEKFSESQFDMLIFVLQDRSALDYSTAGKDPLTGITPHANSEKRFTLFERLTDPNGREQAIREAASPDVITYAMQTLLSYQVRDDKELTPGTLREDDYLENSLHRIQAIDWELLAHACDFVDEIERETNKKTVLSHVADELETSEYEKDSFDEKRVEFYRTNKEELSSIDPTESAESFQKVMLKAYERDRKEMGVEGDDLMGAFMSLEPQEKALFFRALENRDILDVSQKNLYKNVFGMAERDFVDVKGRDALTDEFLASYKNDKSGMINLGKDGMFKAFRSLCTVQINDDMDFEKMNGVNWLDKNLNVNNQLLVFKRNTIVDWKLFKRALQFVIRAGNERKMAAGDEELYHALGDQSFGEMNFDRKYLRRNLHHTGSRFMRFLAKDGYDTVAQKLGPLGTLAGISELVVSKKTANFLHSSANELMKPIRKVDMSRLKLNDDKKLTNDRQSIFLTNLASLSQNLDTQRRILSDMGGNAKFIFDAALDLAGVEKKADKKSLAEQLNAEGKKQADRLDDIMKDLVLERDKQKKKEEEADAENRVTGFKYVDMVFKYGKVAGGSLDMLDKYLIDSPDLLQKVDSYIDKYMGGFLSTQTLGEWYQSAKEWTENKFEYVGNFFLDDNFPEGLKDTLKSILGALETSKGFISEVREYTNIASQVFGDFMDIVGSVSNIKKINQKQEDAKEAEKKDKADVEGIDFTKYDEELVKFAQGNNASLMRVSSDLSKSQEGRKILASVGSLAQKGARVAKLLGAADFSKIIGAAFRTADFFWKCFADNKTVYSYYTQAGNPILKKLIAGKKTLSDTEEGKKLMKEESHEKQDGSTVVGRKEFRLIRNGQGFERDEEIADYLKLNMVHSLLFSASKFNPLTQPRILAECTLTILGLDDCIGKTDNETAVKVFNRLKA